MLVTTINFVFQTKTVSTFSLQGVMGSPAEGEEVVFGTTPYRVARVVHFYSSNKPTATITHRIDVIIVNT